MSRCHVSLLVTGLLTVTAVGAADPAWADGGWVAVAKSPSRESLDWAGGPNRSQADAEVAALQQCARLQHANDCYLVASGPNCAAVAWDVAEPLNNAYGAIGLTRPQRSALPKPLPALSPMAQKRGAVTSGVVDAHFAAGDAAASARGRLLEPLRGLKPIL